MYKAQVEFFEFFAYRFFPVKGTNACCYWDLFFMTYVFPSIFLRKFHIRSDIKMFNRPKSVFVNFEKRLYNIFVLGCIFSSHKRICRNSKMFFVKIIFFFFIRLKNMGKFFINLKKLSFNHIPITLIIKCWANITLALLNVPSLLG